MVGFWVQMVMVAEMVVVVVDLMVEGGWWLRLEFEQSSSGCLLCFGI
jgi:hypothetical protein